MATTSWQGTRSGQYFPQDAEGYGCCGSVMVDLPFQHCTENQANMWNDTLGYMCQTQGAKHGPW